MTLAPIAVFCYNRLSHLQRTVDALRANTLAADSPLTIFSDGPRHPGEAHKIAEVRNYIAGLDGFSSVQIVLADNNKGLATSIISGVTHILKHHNKIIVLEDDILTSPFFLEFMNSALDKLQHHAKVASIGGYIEPTTHLGEIVYLRKGTSWGWGTWRRVWAKVEWNGNTLLDALASSGRANDLDFGTNIGFSRMLEQQVAGKNSSWAIRFYTWSFLNDMLHLLPGTSLVNNIGHDGSGTHCGSNATWNTTLCSVTPIVDPRQPVQENAEAYVKIAEYYKSVSTPSHSILRKAKRLFRNVTNRVK